LVDVAKGGSKFRSGISSIERDIKRTEAETHYAGKSS